MSNQKASRKAHEGTTSAKKPYKAPELQKWGSMRDITLAAGTVSAHSDGAMKSPNKTS